MCVFNYVNNGVLPLLEEIPERANKPWMARAYEGQTISEIKSSVANGEVTIHYLDLNLLDLINEVRLDFLSFRGDEFGYKDLANNAR